MLYLNYIINVEKKCKQLFKDLLANDKITNDEYGKMCLKVLEQKYFMVILKPIDRLLPTCWNFHRFYPWI